MLKLTNYSSHKAVYVAPFHITSILQEDGYTMLLLAGGGGVTVTEPANDIMKMDAMMCHLHPPFLIQTSTKVA